jgi:hypothetical protein
LTRFESASNFKPKQMKVSIEMLDPSPHWIALARVIESSPDLPDDIVLVVRKEGVVLTATGIEIPSGLAAGSYPEGSVYNVEGKVAFLKWLNDQFSRNGCPLPAPKKASAQKSRDTRSASS